MAEEKTQDAEFSDGNPDDDEVIVAEPLVPVNALAVWSPSQMIVRALDGSAKPEILEKLLELQERYDANEARKAFHRAMAAAKAELPATIYKGKSVNAGGVTYKHAELSDIMAAVTPTLGRHGLSLSWKSAQPDKNTLVVTCILSHADGHSKEATLEGGPDESKRMNRSQRLASSLTYLERYTAKEVLGISEGGDDDDGRGTDNPQPEIPPPQREACDKSRARLESIVAWCKDGTDEEKKVGDGCQSLLDRPALKQGHAGKVIGKAKEELGVTGEQLDEGRQEGEPVEPPDDSERVPGED